jgi:Flp pilus assembly protein CpaB
VPLTEVLWLIAAVLAVAAGLAGFVVQKMWIRRRRRRRRARG